MAEPQAASARRAVLVGALLFAAAQAGIVLAGLADGDLLADDAYYYFQIARHAALGQGFSFDGLHPTNGFHPLFAWLCVPLYWLAPNASWGPVHAALVFLGACTGATAWVLYLFGRLTLSERAGGLMALFFLTSPFAWLLPLRGTEEALAALCFALGALQVARVDRAPSVRAAAALGVLLGVAMLARTEYVLWALPVCIWLLWRTRQLKPVLVCGTVASLVLSPWLLWSLARFGTIQQVSGAVKSSIDIYGRFPSTLFPLEFAMNVFLPFQRAAEFVSGEEFAPGPASVLLLAALVGLVLLALVAAGRRRAPGVVALLYAVVGLHLFFYGYVMRHYFAWYFLPVAMVLACFLGERLAYARRTLIVAAASLSTLACAGTLAAFFTNADSRPRSAELRVAQSTRVLAPLPVGTRVGLWNAGAYGYFAGFLQPGVVVVNLDGLVNNALFAAYRRGAYAEWLLGEVDYLVEDLAYLSLYLDRREVEAFRRQHTRVVSREPLLIQVVPGD